MVAYFLFWQNQGNFLFGYKTRTTILSWLQPRKNNCVPTELDVSISAYGISDCVLGAGFTSLTFDAKPSKGNNSPKDFTLSTSPMLATLEKLKKNDEIWISVGRKKRGSSLAISMGQPAILNVKMLAEDKIEEEKIFE